VSIGVQRQIRRTGGRLIRRLRLLPEGDPDCLGDDDALRGQSLPYAVMVYFPDTLTNIYQLRQWYRTLRRLNDRHRVGVVCLDSRTAAAVRAESGLPAVCIGRIATLEDLVSRSDIALALYVNHNVRNLNPLRFPAMLHAYLGHGESDKVASASNQVKAYDFVLVAGEAARERLARTLLRYDVPKHVLTVGRPQLDDAGLGPDPAPRHTHDGDRIPTVLYAPTWEGAQPSMAYGSVRSHGERLVRALLESGRFRVVYRPHPRSGANSAEYAAADRSIRRLVSGYPSAGGIGHRVDLAQTWDARLDPADLLIGDVSAVVTDWMPTGRPVIVTVPVSADVDIDADSILSVVPTLAVADLPTVVCMVDRALAGDDDPRRAHWLRQALGDTTPGSATQRFLDVCDELVRLRGHDLSERAARNARL
jgi:hypothetical protein